MATESKNDVGGLTIIAGGFSIFSAISAGVSLSRIVEHMNGWQAVGYAVFSAVFIAIFSVVLIQIVSARNE